MRKVHFVCASRTATCRTSNCEKFDELAVRMLYYYARQLGIDAKFVEHKLLIVDK